MDLDDEKLVWGDIKDYSALAFHDVSTGNMKRFTDNLELQKVSLVEAFVSFVLASRGFTFDTPMDLENFDKERYVEEFTDLPLSGPHNPGKRFGDSWDARFKKGNQKLKVTVFMEYVFAPTFGREEVITSARKLAKKYDSTGDDEERVFLHVGGFCSNGPIKDNLKDLIMEDVFLGPCEFIDYFSDTESEKKSVINRWRDIRDLILDNFREENKGILKMAEKSSDDSKEDLKSLIEKGETESTEFKETFVYDVKKGEENRGLKEKCVKEICGLANTEGGRLIIGVQDDSKEINGLGRDLDLLGGKDNFRNQLIDLVEQRIDVTFANLFIDIRFLEMEEGKEVCVVDVKKADCPCYYQGDELIVRTDTQTKNIRGTDRKDYIKSRFMRKGEKENSFDESE